MCAERKQHHELGEIGMERESVLLDQDKKIGEEIWRKLAIADCLQLVGVRRGLVLCL